MAVARLIPVGARCPWFCSGFSRSVVGISTERLSVVSDLHPLTPLSARRRTSEKFRRASLFAICM